MKTLNLILFVSVFAAIGMLSCEKEQSIPYEQLPGQTKNLIETYFSDVTIARVAKETKTSIPYEVVLSNGTEIECDTNGMWEDIDGNGNPLPQDILNLLPASIAEYVAANYPGFSVVKIDKEHNFFELELNDDTELQFDRKGNFLRIDEKGTSVPDNTYNESNYELLPQVAKDFLSTHYDGIKVTRVEYEKHDSTPYEVRLENGTTLEFDTNGKWMDIEGGNKALPASVTALLPSGITGYVAQKYTNLSIVKIDKEPNTIEIELSNNLELIFNANGNFIRIDD